MTVLTAKQQHELCDRLLTQVEGLDLVDGSTALATVLCHCCRGELDKNDFMRWLAKTWDRCMRQPPLAANKPGLRPTQGVGDA